jgi:hypothetical protein
MALKTIRMLSGHERPISVEEMTQANVAEPDDTDPVWLVVISFEVGAKGSVGDRAWSKNCRAERGPLGWQSLHEVTPSRFAHALDYVPHCPQRPT